MIFRDVKKNEDNMSTYKNSLSPEKQVAREKVLEYAKKYLSTRRKTKLLSLPADNFIFERMFMDTFHRAEIKTAEMDKDTYKHGLKVAKELKISHDNEEIFTKLLKDKEKYDIIWLDLCGCLRPSLINSLIPVVQSNFTKDKAIIGLTVMKARENMLQRNPRLYGFNKVSRFREVAFPKMLAQFANMNNCELELLELYSYRGNYENATPMNLYIFLLTK